ncbi:MAG: TetR/AcrR family transcriptional regulator [Telmatospirillum sp.]|nr:TetR/AcrR family transcriptional regulator [Telmatospirillum sp.]
MRKMDPDRHEAKRRQILKAAAACFSRKGFHRTSTAEICTEAEMSPGNLFHYFPTKQAIIAALVEEERGQTADYFAQVRDTADPLGEILGFVDIALLYADTSDYLRLVIDISAEAMRDTQIAGLVSGADDDVRHALADLLRRAAALGQTDPSLDPEDAARWIVAVIDGIFSRTAVDPGFQPKSQRTMARRLVARFLAPPPGPRP